MTNKKITVALPGSSFLGILFIVLKVTETVNWPWSLVLLPFWLPFAIFGAIIAIPLAAAAIAGIGIGLITFFSWLNNYIRRKFD